MSEMPPVRLSFEDVERVRKIEKGVIVDAMVWVSMIGWAALVVLHFYIKESHSSRGWFSEEWFELYLQQRTLANETIVAGIEAVTANIELMAAALYAWGEARDEAIEARIAAVAEAERVVGLAKELDARVASFTEALESLPCPKCHQ